MASELIWSWSVVAEFLGFVSAVLLLVPPLSANKLLRNISEIENMFSKSKTELRKIGPAIKSKLREECVPAWSLRDQLMLAFGAALLAVSFIIKFLIVWNTPITST